MNRIFTAIAILALGISSGCHAQVPPPSPQPSVVLTCIAPVGFTAGTGNGFVFSRAVCVTATSCPANTAGNTSYTALAPMATTCAYTDSTPPSGFVTYTASTVQNGLTSLPSGQVNNGTPLTVPTYPGAPGTLNGTQTAALAPPLTPNTKPAPVDAKVQGPTGLTAKLEKR